MNQLPFSNSTFRALRTIARHPGSIPEDVALRAFHGPNLMQRMGGVSRVLRELKKKKLVKVGYALIHTADCGGRWAANYTYYVTRRGFEVLKSDERWESNH